MYRKPSSFNAIVKHERLYVIKFSAGDEYFWQVKEILEKLKPINRTDKSFCFTCLCNYNEGLTVWQMGYASYHIKKEAMNTLEECIEGFNDGESSRCGMDSSGFVGCSCPFN